MKVKGLDLFVIVFFLLVSILLLSFKLLPKGEKTIIEITAEGEKQVFDTAQKRTLRVEASGYCLTVEIRAGKVRVSQADCPDRTCYKTGWIHRPGEAIACIPAGVLIEIKGEGASAYDAVSG